MLTLGAVWLHAQVAIGLTIQVPGYPFPPVTATQPSWPTGLQGPVALNYSVSGVSGIATSPVITVVLPTNFTYVGLSTNPDVVSSSYNGGTRTLTINLVSPMSTGTTGVVGVLGNFPFGTTPDGAIATLNATFTAAGVSNSPVNASGNVEADAMNPWDIVKTRTSGGALDGNTTYRIRFPDANKTFGAMYVVNATITDQLPPNTTYISSSPAGAVYTAGTNTVTWTGASLINTDANTDYTVTVSYESANGFATGQSVTNSVSITGDLATTGGVVYTDNASVSHTIQDFIGGGCSGTTSVNRAVVGSTGTFTMQPINSSTKTVDNFKVTMNLSPLVAYSTFTKGKFGTVAYQTKNVTVYYTSNLVTTPTVLTTYVTEAVPTTATFNPPTLAVGDYLTKIIYERVYPF